VFLVTLSFVDNAYLQNTFKFLHVQPLFIFCSYCMMYLAVLFSFSVTVITHVDGSRVSIVIMCLCLCVSHDKTKTAETKIIKLGTQIVHHDTTPTNEYLLAQRSRLGLRLGDRVADVSYASLSSASLVYPTLPQIKSNQKHIYFVKRRMSQANQRRIMYNCVCSVVKFFVICS